MFPQDILQLLVIVGAVVPGFVYQISRRQVRGPGPDEQSITIRVLRSIATSVVFLCLYIFLFDYPPAGVSVGPDGVPESWRTVALGTLIFVLAVPWLAARVIYYLVTLPVVLAITNCVAEKLTLRSQWDPTPSAWDFAFSNREWGWVRVQTTDGAWMGGWFGPASFATSFPEPREMYLEQGYEMTEEGTFTGRISAVGGLYIRCEDIRILDFPADVEGNEEESTSTPGTVHDRDSGDRVRAEGENEGDRKEEA